MQSGWGDGGQSLPQMLRRCGWLSMTFSEHRRPRVAEEDAYRRLGIGSSAAIAARQTAGEPHPAAHFYSGGLGLARIDFQNMADGPWRGVSRKVGGLLSRRLWWRVPGDMSYRALGVDPYKVQGEIHLYHPEDVRAFLFVDEEHPCSRRKKRPARQPLSTLAWREGQLHLKWSSSQRDSCRGGRPLCRTRAGRGWVRNGRRRRCGWKRRSTCEFRRLGPGTGARLGSNSG